MKLYKRHKDMLSIIKGYPEGAKESFLLGSMSLNITKIQQILADLVEAGRVTNENGIYKIKEK